MKTESEQEGPLAVIACILQRAVEDVADGLRDGVLADDLAIVNGLHIGSRKSPDWHSSRRTMWAEDAARFLRSNDAATLCSWINEACGRTVIHPEALIRRARQMAKGAVFIAAENVQRRRVREARLTSMRGALRA